MNISEIQIKGLGVALNEATLLGAEYSPEQKKMGITFSVLTLPSENDLKPNDKRISLVLEEIGRIAVSLRNGRWDDDNAEIVKFELPDFFKIVQENCGGQIYGWEYFNIAEKEFPKWENKLSMDFVNPEGSLKNNLVIFQEGRTEDKILDMCFWFESFKIFTPRYKEIPIEEFIAGGKRWWDALFDHDPRTEGHWVRPLEDSEDLENES